MGEITVYECDRCGDRYGSKNHIREYKVKYMSKNAPFEVRQVSQAICHDCRIDAGVDKIPRQLWWVGIADDNVLGARYESPGRGNEYGAYRDLEHIPEKYHDFLELVEEIWNE